MSSKGPNMLVIEDVSFGFHRRMLFSGLNFKVEAGELWHLKGPNGTGKSTLLALIAGLLETRSGRVAYYTANEEVDARLYLEYLPAEANGLYGRMDATQNLTFWQKLRGHKPDKTAIQAELATWNLNHPLLREGFAVEKFSTGMKRRLALARVNLSQAPLWLLDEPLYGLDQDGISTFRTILSQHLKKGGATLMVSHDEAAFANFNPRVLELGRP